MLKRSTCNNSIIIGNLAVIYIIIVVLTLSISSSSSSLSKRQIVFPDEVPREKSEFLDFSDTPVLVTHSQPNKNSHNGDAKGNQFNQSPKQQQLQGAKYDELQDELEAEYYDELVYGHRANDPEKFRRQKGCLCNNYLKDPHCGSDRKLYDNGCYFDCAQKRNPRLFLQKWGPCS